MTSVQSAEVLTSVIIFSIRPVQFLVRFQVGSVPSTSRFPPPPPVGRRLIGVSNSTAAGIPFHCHRFRPLRILYQYPNVFFSRVFFVMRFLCRVKLPRN